MKDDSGRNLSRKIVFNHRKTRHYLKQHNHKYIGMILESFFLNLNPVFLIHYELSRSLSPIYFNEIRLKNIRPAIMDIIFFVINIIIT